MRRISKALLATGLAGLAVLGTASPALADVIQWQPTATLGQPWKVKLSVSDSSGGSALPITAWFRPVGGQWAPTTQTFSLPRVSAGEFDGTMDVVVTAPGDWAFCTPAADGAPSCGVPDIDGSPEPFPRIAAPETIKQGVAGFAQANGNLPTGQVGPKPGSFEYKLPVVFSPAAGQNAILEWGYFSRNGTWVWQKARTVPVPTTPDTPVSVTLTRPPKSQFSKIITFPMSSKGGSIGVAYRLRVPAVNGLAEITSPEVRVSWTVLGKEVPKKWRLPKTTAGSPGTSSCLSCAGVGGAVSGGLR